MVESGVMEDYTYLWYDVRPHPLFGTVEIRACDSQTRVEHTLALAALIQAMVKELAEHFDAGTPLTDYPWQMLDENKWLAARHGLEGELVDLPERERVPTRQLARRLIDRLRERAQQLGGETELAAGIVQDFHGNLITVPRRFNHIAGETRNAAVVHTRGVDRTDQIFNARCTKILGGSFAELCRLAAAVRRFRNAVESFAGDTAAAAFVPCNWSPAAGNIRFAFVVNPDTDRSGPGYHDKAGLSKGCSVKGDVGVGRDECFTNIIPRYEAVTYTFADVLTSHTGQPKRRRSNISAGQTANVAHRVNCFRNISDGGFNADSQRVRRSGKTFALYVGRRVNYYNMRLGSAAVHAQIQLVRFVLAAFLGGNGCHIGQSFF